jgi:hypothetical protein
MWKIADVAVNCYYCTGTKISCVIEDGGPRDGKNKYWGNSKSPRM